MKLSCVSLLILGCLQTLYGISTEYDIEDVISITTVPTFTKSKSDVEFPVDKVEVRFLHI